MPTLFNSDPGVWVRIKGTGAGAGTALIDVEGLFKKDNLIVTQFTFSQAARVQYKPTLGGHVYVYPLGDNMGEVRISGLASFKDCKGKSGDGFQKLAAFYAERKASNIKNISKPIKIVLPGLTNYTTSCFLETLSISGVDPENRVFGYELGFKVAPAQ
tara:strand:- start:38 stop:511 length:474 start_codon:yes stop_codon:yes gene_type:complete